MDPKNSRVSDEDEQISVTRNSSVSGSRSSSRSRSHSASNNADTDTEGGKVAVAAVAAVALNLDMKSTKAMVDEEVLRENPSPKSKESEDQYQSTEKLSLKRSRHFSVADHIEERQPMVNLFENSYKISMADYIHKEKHLLPQPLSNTLYLQTLYGPTYSTVASDLPAFTKHLPYPWLYPYDCYRKTISPTSPSRTTQQKNVITYCAERLNLAPSGIH